MPDYWAPKNLKALRAVRALVCDNFYMLMCYLRNSVVDKIPVLGSVLLSYIPVKCGDEKLVPHRPMGRKGMQVPAGKVLEERKMGGVMQRMWTLGHVFLEYPSLIPLAKDVIGPALTAAGFEIGSSLSFMLESAVALGGVGPAAAMALNLAGAFLGASMMVNAIRSLAEGVDKVMLKGCPPQEIAILSANLAKRTGLFGSLPETVIAGIRKAERMAGEGIRAFSAAAARSTMRTISDSMAIVPFDAEQTPLKKPTKRPKAARAKTPKTKHAKTAGAKTPKAKGKAAGADECAGIGRGRAASEWLKRNHPDRGSATVEQIKLAMRCRKMGR